MTAPAAPPPDVLWMFDASRQLLVFREPGSSRAFIFPEAILARAGWKAAGLRQSLPRCALQTGGPLR